MLRAVKQANRLMGSSNPSELPAPEEMGVMAQILGFSDSESLASEVHESMIRTRKIFEASMGELQPGGQA